MGEMRELERDMERVDLRDFFPWVQCNLQSRQAMPVVSGNRHLLIYLFDTAKVHGRGHRAMCCYESKYFITLI
jgi:hypothetical protein